MEAFAENSEVIEMAMSEDNPIEISVIIPVYNMTMDGLINRCMDSLIGQTFLKENYEIIAVDDCSSDNSYAVLGKIKAQNTANNITVLKSPNNVKIGGARNLGLRFSKGKYVTFVDADDYVSPDYLEQLYDTMKREAADLVGAFYQRVQKDGTVVFERPTVNIKSQGEMSSEKRKLLFLDPGYVWCKLYKADILKNIRPQEGLFPQNMFFEDNAVSQDIMMHFHKTALVNKPLYFYYINPMSVTQRKVTIDWIEDRLQAGRILVKIAEKSDYYDELKSEISLRFSELFYYNTLPHVCSLEGNLFKKAEIIRSIRKERKAICPELSVREYIAKKHCDKKQRLFYYLMEYCELVGITLVQVRRELLNIG